MMHLLGQIADDRGETQKAIDAMRIACDLDQEAVEYAVDLIHLLLREGRVDEAKDVLMKARAVAPGDPSLVEAATWFKRRVRIRPDLWMDSGPS